MNQITNSNLDKNLLKLIEEVYIPLSHIIGINYYVAQFEDYAIRTKYPKEYTELLRKSKKNLIRDNKEIEEILAELEKFRKSPNEEFYGRIKNPYSVFKKVYIKKTPLEEIQDFVAIRIITNSLEDCYSWLGYVFSKWDPIIGRIKDYLENPKPNGYKSLHTTIITKYGNVEVQIRTKGMHEFAEFGVASHWRYKGIEDFQILDKLQRNVAKISESGNSFKLGDEKIFVITPKGDYVILDKGASVLDFAFAIHTEIGCHIVRAIVNNEPVSLNQKLNDYDHVMIFTDKNRKPTRKWLEFVTTKKAIDKIRQVLGITVVDKAKEFVSEKNDILKRTNIASCCNPFYKDEVALYKTSKRKFVIHTVECLLRNAKQYESVPEIVKQKLMQKKISLRIEPNYINEIIKQLDIRLHYENIVISTNKDELIISTKILSKDDAQDIVSKLLNINGIINAKMI